MFQPRLLSVLFVLVLLSLLEASVLNCFRCGTLTASSPPGRTNETGEPSLSVGVRTLPGGDPSSSILELESCAEFEKPGASSYLYQVTCGGDGGGEEKQICAKIVSYSDETEDAMAGGGRKGRATVVQRGCAYASTAMGQSHPIGCGFMYPPVASRDVKYPTLLQSEHICYCDSNYCNSAQLLSSSIFSILTLVFFFSHLHTWLKSFLCQ